MHIHRCINVFFLKVCLLLSPSTCSHSGDHEIFIMVDMKQEALPEIEDKILNELQFIPMQRNHAPPSTPFIALSNFAFTHNSV